VTRSVVWWSIVLALLVGGCAHRRPPGEAGADWALIRPPEIADLAAPRGTRLVSAAPQSEWLRQDTFDSEGECDDVRQKNAQTAITRARASAGDDAKFDLDVRRAVNARCVRLAR
jgi:hypothetical protein